MKRAPDDFSVEELPLYEASGEGEHIYLEIEKRGLTTTEVEKRLARAFGIKRRDVGYAGMKDRHAVTRQWFSVLGTGSEVLPEQGASEIAEDPAITVVRVTRHRNKLKTGHLRGNRFTLRVHGAVACETDLVAACERITRYGYPNYYGAQRFGVNGDNIRTARELLTGWPATRSRRRKQDRFLVSALQSAVFNGISAWRIGMGLGARVAVGDVLQRVASGGCFVCEDAEVDQSRLELGELVITGPMPGDKTLSALGAPGRLESWFGRAFGIGFGLGGDPLEASKGAEMPTWADEWRLPIGSKEHPPFVSIPQELARGARRAMMVRPLFLECTSVAPPESPAESRDEPLERELVLRFDLPPGAYATELVREISGATARTESST